MADYRQSSEIAERRQICDRINDLKSSCERLSRIRDELSDRLSKLNVVVDRLIDEKMIQKYDPNLKIDLTSYYISSESSQIPKNHHREQKTTSTTTATDLVVNTDILSRNNSNTNQKSSSEAFKIKLSHCLSEIAPKAEEIVERCDDLYQFKI